MHKSNGHSMTKGQVHSSTDPDTRLTYSTESKWLTYETKIKIKQPIFVEMCEEQYALMKQNTIYCTTWIEKLESKTLIEYAAKN